MAFYVVLVISLLGFAILGLIKKRYVVSTLLILSMVILTTILVICLKNPHIYYVATMPNLHEPVVKKKIDISTENKVLLDNVRLPLNDEYSIGFCAAKGDLPSDYKFTGRCLPVSNGS